MKRSLDRSGSSESSSTNDSHNAKRPRRAEEILKTTLDCPICETTMEPPIYLCDVGHTVCKVCAHTLPACPQDNCNRKISGISRNMLLERAAEEMYYPCRKPGCIARLQLVDRAQHENVECEFRKIDCPLGDCGWQGPLPGFRAHIVAGEHPVQVLLGTNFPFSTMLRFPIPETSGDRFVFLSRDQNLFKITVNNKKKLGLFITAKYYGPMSTCKSFRCEIQLTGSNKDGPIDLQYSFTVQHDTEDTTDTAFLLPSREFLVQNNFIRFSEAEEFSRLLPKSWFTSKGLFTDEMDLYLSVKVDHVDGSHFIPTS